MPARILTILALTLSAPLCAAHAATSTSVSASTTPAFTLNGAVAGYGGVYKGQAAQSFQGSSGGSEAVA